MERDVMDIIKDKEFIELTAAERTELGELCSSEDEYNQVKSMFAGMSAMDWSNPTPKPETKESLDHLFAQKYPATPPVWYNAPLALLIPKEKPFYRQPLVQIAAVGLLVFLAYPFMNSNEMVSNANQVAMIEKESAASEEEKGKNEMPKEDQVDENATDASAPSIESTSAEKSFQTPALDDEFTFDLTTTPKPAATRSLDGIEMASTEVLDPEEDSQFRSTVGESGAAKPGSSHPDGIFIGTNKEVFSAPASQEPAVFDLLTSSF